MTEIFRGYYNMSEFAPIVTRHLFPVLDALLIDLLKNLQPEDWKRPTVARQWTIKDIAAHLLDGNLRTISVIRDQFLVPPADPINSYADLIKYLNRLNADFVQAFKNISPGVLVELLESTGRTFSGIMASLSPNEPAVFSVAWAGQTQSPNWFHVAREYTEKWHHQQQIRAAMGLELPLYQRELHHPYLQVSMYALPYQFRHIQAEEGDLVKISVSGEGGGEWYLQRHISEWKLVEPATETPACSVAIEEDWAWRIFMNAATAAEAEKHVTITGKTELGLPIFDIRAVMV